MAQYLVTGGSGFIGSNLVAELLQRGHRVRVLDNFSTGRRPNLAPFLADIELIEGDIRSYHIVARAVMGVDNVLHQAALGSIPRSIGDPITTNEVSVTGTLNLLLASVEAGVRRFVYASSSSIYGDNPVSPKVETMAPNPKSPYAVAKLGAETYCRVFHQIYGLETVALRYFNVFGPNQDPNSQYAAVIPRFLGMMTRGERPTIFGDGLTSRDFTFVENNVRANLLACEAPNVGGQVYNIACGTSFTLRELVTNLNTILGTSIEPEFAPARAGDIQHSKADIAKAQSELGYTPRVGFDEGLRRLVAGFGE
jgi:nucleoside-diphosphate-sugar epimerase